MVNLDYKFKGNEWRDFYRSISDTTWPVCAQPEDVVNLPNSVQQEIVKVHIPNLIANTKENKQHQHAQPLKDWRGPETNHSLTLAASTPNEVDKLYNFEKVDYYNQRTSIPPTHEVDCGGITVKYHVSMECGGIRRKEFFVNALDIIAPGKVFEHCLDWCSGPGFIGYTILGTNHCQKLDLADIYAPSLEASQSAEPAEQRATPWHIQRLSDVPEGNSYDLIVGAPPWFPGQLILKQRTTCDSQLKIHQEFFQDVGAYLKPGGVIILIEGQTYLGPRDLEPLLRPNGLEIKQVLMAHDDWHWFPVIQRIQD